MLFKKLFSDTLMALISNVTCRLLNAVAFIIMANYLSKTQYGIYATALAFVGIFIVFRDLGTKNYMIQESSRDKSKTNLHYGNTTLIQVALIFILYASIILVAKLLNYPPVTVTLISILGIGQLVFEQRLSAYGILRVHLRNNVISFFEVAQSLAVLIAVLVIIQTTKSPDIGLIRIAWIQFFINLILVAALFAYVSRKIAFPIFDLKHIPLTLKKSLVFALSDMFFLLYFQVDQVVISLFRDPREVAIYTVPFKCIVFFLFVPRILFGIMNPIMYGLFFNDLKKYKRINYFMHRYQAAFGIPVAIAIIILAKPIIELFFKDSYNESILVLSLFGWFLIPRFLAAASTRSLTTQCLQKIKTTIQAILVLTNLVLDIILVYKFGYLGAVFATLFVETIMDILIIYYSQKHLKEPFSKMFTTIIPVFLASATMGIIVYFLKNLNIFFVTMAGFLIYGASLYFFRFFQDYDFKLFSQIFRRKKPMDNI